jgi:hypothetical protein
MTKFSKGQRVVYKPVGGTTPSLLPFTEMPLYELSFLYDHHLQADKNRLTPLFSSPRSIRSIDLLLTLRRVGPHSRTPCTTGSISDVFTAPSIHQGKNIRASATVPRYVIMNGRTGRESAVLELCVLGLAGRGGTGEGAGLARHTNEAGLECEHERRDSIFSVQAEERLGGEDYFGGMEPDPQIKTTKDVAAMDIETETNFPRRKDMAVAPRVRVTNWKLQRTHANASSDDWEKQYLPNWPE